MQAPLQAKNDSNAAKTDVARTVAQKRVFADNRPEAMAQHQLAEMMNNSPRVLQQRALSDAIHNSPRMIAQRHEMNVLFGGAVRPQRGGAMSAELSPAQREEKPNHTGLPDQLMSGIESLSGMSMGHVKVHYNSDRPAQLHAHAYAQGSEIHVAPGQEQHLPHEAWHVVQQAQGWVRPTMQMKGGVVQLGRSTESGDRRKKMMRQVRRNKEPRSLRGGEQRSAIRLDLKNERQKRMAKAAYRATSTFRTAVGLHKAAYAGYPVGSYANGRYMYLNNALQGLGALPRSLKDLVVSNTAAVEVDHSPHDGAQRPGARQDDEALKYRVAVPLPRSWHRRHQTTHGAGATRHNPIFSDAQSNLVKQQNKYADALLNHLLDTFHPDAVGNTGQKKIELVAHHTINALNYAASNEIAVKIHPNHLKNEPAITAAEKNHILANLKIQLEAVKHAKAMPGLVNPF